MKRLSRRQLEEHRQYLIEGAIDVNRALDEALTENRALREFAAAQDIVIARLKEQVKDKDAKIDGFLEHGAFPW